jgi:HEAT repeats
VDTGVQSPPEKDPRLQPAPDYGSLGPSSDARGLSAAGKNTDIPQGPSLKAFIAVAIGTGLGLLAMGLQRGAWLHISDYLNKLAISARSATGTRSGTKRNFDPSAQKQAELLLQRAINHDQGAPDQITQQVEHWRRARIRLTPQLNGLLTAAFDSNDLSVRAAGVEVDLAAMNLAKVPSNIDVMEKEAESNVQSERVWGLWTLGLLGNRGVEPERVAKILVAHLHDSDPEVRHWTVESLALLGTDEAIPHLLQALHDDPSPMLRERAACGIAQSGFFTDRQRRSTVPQLLDFTADPALDAQTHAWVFHALRDITRQNLPDDTAAWRNWYSTAPGN